MKKKTLFIWVIAVQSVIISNIAYSYKFTFTNTNEGPVEIRIALSGINEPWYQTSLQGADVLKGSSYTFDFNVGKKAYNADEKELEDTSRKQFFCLSDIQIAPWRFNSVKRIWEKSDHWLDMAPVFIESVYFEKMLEASAEVAKGATQAAGKLMEEVSKMGMSLAAERAGAALRSMDLSEFVKAIGGAVKFSLCKSRGFTIFPNIKKNGELAPGYVVTTNAR